MKASIHTHLTKAIVPAVLAAGLAVPAAVAGNSYPDAVGRVQVGHAVGTADTLRPARESGAQDAVGTLVAPDSLRPARESGAQEVGGALVSPDTLRPVRESGSPDAATLAGMQVVKIVESGGFDWADAGIGAGGGIAFLLVLAAGGSMLLRGKARPIKA